MNAYAAVELTTALAKVWDAIRCQHPEVPSVVLLAAPNPHGHRGVLGHFAALRWQALSGAAGKHLHEVVVVAEHLNRSAEDVVGTLLHEAAHALNFERGVKDCSRSQYHNQHFKAAAEEIGLSVDQVPHYGFARTAMLPVTAMRYASETAGLSVVLMHRREFALPSAPPGGGAGATPGSDAPAEKGGRYKKASCACPFNIRVARATMEATVIRCESCGEPFQLAA